MGIAEPVYFDVFDYSIFIILLCLSGGIGVYFGYSSRKQQSTSDYLYGSRQMKAIPVGLSLYSSTFSAISIIGMPYEIYNFGTHYVTAILGIILGMFLIWYTVLPVFCGNLCIKTPYEYFERRFSYKVRLLSTCIHIFHTLMLMPITLYAPSTALSYVTQMPVLVCTTLIGSICILYTTIGGFKAVIWTDTLQASLMLLSCIVIAIVGVAQAGGIFTVWDKAQEGNIIHFFNMDPNPLKRISFWTMTIGFSFLHLGHSGCSASGLQRYMSVPGQREARISTAIGSISSTVLHITSLILGLAMYAAYYKCDPTLNGDIKAANRITTHFVTETIRGIPGFNGFFMAGLLSAALSTLSSELNTVGGLIYYDIILKNFKQKWIVARGANIMKIIILINGIIYLCMVPLVQSPHVYELTLSISGITYGAKIGMLLLGIFFLKVNTKGVMCGVLASISIMIWINIGAHRYNIKSYDQYRHSTENCPVSNNTDSIITKVTETTFLASTIDVLITTSVPSSIIGNITASNVFAETNSTVISTIMQTLQKPNLDDIFFLYRISVFYYALFGTIIVLLVAVIVSYLTGTNDIHKIDPLLVSPLLRTYVQKQQTAVSGLQIEFNEKICDEI